MLKLSNYLINPGRVDVILDQHELSAGKNLIHFMEHIEKADKVIVVMTPEYKRKAENRERGVGFEYTLITQELFELQKDNKKFIPVLRSGDKDSSIPAYLKSLIYHEMRDEDQFNTDAFILLKLIHDEPEIIKPELGQGISLKEFSPDPILEVAESIARRRAIKAKKNIFFESSETGQIAENQIQELKKSVADKANFYKEKTGIFFKAVSSNRGYQEFDEIILNTLGVGSNIIIRRQYHNSLPEMSIEIIIWDRQLISDQGAYYISGREPKKLKSISLHPWLDDDLNILWCNEDLKYLTHEIRDLAFSMLLEQANKNDQNSDS